MLKIKRAGAILVVVVFLVTCLFAASLTGCSKKENGGQNTSIDTGNTVQSQQQTTAETKEELQPVKLKWYGVNPKQNDAQSVYDAANKIIQQKLNATVDFQWEDFGVYAEKMKMIAASGEECDIVWTSSWCNPYIDNVNKGAYMPLDDLLDKYAPDVKALIPAPPRISIIVGNTPFAFSLTALK